MSFPTALSAVELRVETGEVRSRESHRDENTVAGGTMDEDYVVEDGQDDVMIYVSMLIC